MVSAALAQLRLNDRLAKRHRLEIETTIRVPDGPEILCHIDNISALGFSGYITRPMHVPGDVIVHVPIIGDVEARLIWNRQGRIGGEFNRAIDADAMVRTLKSY